MRKGCGKIFLLFVGLIFFMNFISAVEYCVKPTLTDISPSSVGIDEEFTVGILLENCGSLSPKTINFELKDISSEIYIREPLIKNISGINYAADRFLNYHMKTSSSIIPGTYYINYKIKYSGEGETITSDNGNFSITVIGDRAELNIASAKLKPVLPREKETVELTLRIENFGDGIANSIKVELNHSFLGAKESFIGTLESDEDGPAVFTFIAPKEGEYTIPVTITYEDDFGKQEFKTEIKIQIVKDGSKVIYVIISVIVLAVIGWLIFYALKIKQSKEKVIHQLLKETDSGKKKNLKKK